MKRRIHVTTIDHGKMDMSHLVIKAGMTDMLDKAILRGTKSLLIIELRTMAGPKWDDLVSDPADWDARVSARGQGHPVRPDNLARPTPARQV